MASSKHSVLGDVCSLRSKASLQTARPTLLSILGYIEITSHDTSKVPAGNGKNLLLISVTLLRRAVVSMYICGSFLMQGCKKYSVNNDKFSTAVPLPDVINLTRLFHFIRPYANYVRPKIWWLDCRIRALDLLFWIEMTT